MNENKLCLLCNKIIRGRSDKKFCNDYCRNLFNNKKKLPLTEWVKKTNQILLLNRKILENMLTETKLMNIVEAKMLVDLGFHFEFTTAQHLNKTGTRYYYCYEYGYFPLKGNKYLVFEKS